MRAFLLFVTLILSAQAVEVPREQDHFVFTVAWGGGAVPRAKHLVPMSLGFPDESGLVAQCYITVDWWTLFGEPVENYIVEWKRSDHFRTKDSTGSSVTVTADDVAKYPDLKLRFESLVPQAMDFAVEYSLDYMGRLAGDDKAKLNERFARQREATNMASRYAAERIVKNDQFLFARSGTTPLSVPGSHSWSDFINSEVGRGLHTRRSLIPAEKEIIAETLKRIRSLEAMGIQIIRFEPPTGEMRAIADKLRAYREGKEKPTPEEEVKAALAKEVPQYDAKDEWAEAAEKPRPPETPKPRKDPDGLYYFYFSDGQKAFPQGFIVAEEFCAEPYQVSKVRIGKSSSEEPRWNFIDLECHPVLPFDTKSPSSHWGSGLFSVENPQRPGVVNNAGLYDALKKTFLLPMEYNWVSGDEWTDKEHRKFTTRKILSAARNTYTKIYDGYPFKAQVRDVSSEHNDYEWETNSRALRRTKTETKNWQAGAEYFTDPLN